MQNDDISCRYQKVPSPPSQYTSIIPMTCTPSHHTSYTQSTPFFPSNTTLPKANESSPSTTQPAQIPKFLTGSHPHRTASEVQFHLPNLLHARPPALTQTTL